MSDDRWKRISQLYHDAQALAPGERSEFLRQACGQDPELRREVESLLLENPSLERLLGAQDARVNFSGRRIGSYEILSLIGAGGMGEVYRARDTKLDREIAVKILPRQVASDPERVARLRREARLLASLNHPNIATIHAVEEDGGALALVLELVGGETLEDRIARAPLTAVEAVTIARQIVEALDAAHEHGIIHRDLKPANIKLTPEGQVKVLDFGLAKASKSAEPDLTHSSTVDTRVGMILGTAAYMSPEQARGMPTDKRSDIWAFGCVLFEMLSGRPVFEGATYPEVIANTLHSEPDWAALNPQTPPSVRRLLEMCLAKEARDRLRDIADARDYLSPPRSLQRDLPARDMRMHSAVWVGAGIALLAVMILLRPFGRSERSEPRAVERYAIELPPGVHLRTNAGQRVVISRDGRLVAFSAERDGVQRLYVRRLDSLNSAPIPGTEGDVGEKASLFLSPDGQWLGFYDVRTSALRKIPVSGGAAVMITDRTGFGRAGGFVVGGGASWGNGIIVFSGDESAGLSKVSDAGGTPEALTQPEPGTTHRQPHVLSDGKTLVYTVLRRGKPPMVAAMSLSSGEQRVLVDGSYPRVIASTGQLIFVRGNHTLWSARFDPAKLAVIGEASRIEEDLGNFANYASYDVSDEGTFVYTRTEPNRKLLWVDREGREDPLPVPHRTYLYPRISPDGTRVALDIRDEREQGDIWIFDFKRAALTRFADTGLDRHPVWTRDGMHIVFGSGGQGNYRLYSQSSDGLGKPRLIGAETTESPIFPLSFSRDGSHVVVRTTASDWNLKLLSVADGVEQPLLATEWFETNGEISPDGKWIAYEYQEASRRDVYVRPFPHVQNGRWLISPQGGSQPAWSRSGRELFYLDLNGLLTSVDVVSGPAFGVSAPTRLLSQPYLFHSVWSPGRTYDVSLDAKRFLMIKEAEPPRLVVIRNWVRALNAESRPSSSR